MNLCTIIIIITTIIIMSHIKPNKKRIKNKIKTERFVKTLSLSLYSLVMN